MGVVELSKQEIMTEGVKHLVKEAHDKEMAQMRGRRFVRKGTRCI